jgi:hypothetical protein
MRKMAFYVNTDAAQTATLAKFDYIVYNVAPLSSVTAYNTQTTAVQAINANTQVGNYVIAYETPHLGGQLQSIQSITRSGTTVTVTTQNTQGTAAAPVITNGGTAWIMCSTVSAYNGSWTVTGVSGNTWTFTAAGAAATAGDDSAGEGFCCMDSTVARYIMNGQKTGNVPAFTGATAFKDQASWLVRKMGTSGRRRMWTTGFPNWEVNLTNWTTPDANGDRPPQWFAKWYRGAHHDSLKLNFAFIDNYIDQRTDAINNAFSFNGNAGSANTTKGNWKCLSGTSWQNHNDADVVAAHRAGLAAFAQAIRDQSVGKATSPNLFCMGNHDSLSGTSLPTGYEDTIECAYLELFLDLRSQSLATWCASSFSTQMALLVGCAGKLKSHARSSIMLHCTMAAKANYSAVRFACAMALMRDQAGVVAQATDDTSGTGGKIPTYYDEYDIPLGAAVDGVQSAAFSGTLWKREYQKALVLMNPGASTQSIDLTGQGWSFYSGTLDTTVNSGAAVTGTLNVPAATAYILTKP